MKFKINDEVFLLETAYYRLTRYNPKQGTKLECIGIINHIGRFGDIGVKWSNGARNTYKSTDLVLTDNILINCNNIW